MTTFGWALLLGMGTSMTLMMIAHCLEDRRLSSGESDRNNSDDELHEAVVQAMDYRDWRDSFVGEPERPV